MVSRMKHEFWTIAYRKRQGENTLLDDTATGFLEIPNSWRYWYADPHLICREGKTWVFAEAYDRVLRRGVISCCTVGEQGTGPWKVVLKQPYHLSYPHLLCRGDDMYMIPESYVANEIAVFKAVRFPDRWEKAAVLKTGGEPVDSTVFHFDGRRWLLTMTMSGGVDRLMLYGLQDDGTLGEGFCVREADANSRPAGHFFCHDGRLLRPAQDCTESYGCALNFFEVTDVAEEHYAETLIRKIYPDEVRSDLRYPHQGLHTYNFTDSYEVIDIKGYETDLLYYVMRPLWFIWRRVRKVFGR